MKYLEAFLNTPQKKLSHPREEEPRKPQKPVFAVSAGRHARGTEKILPATRAPQRSVSPPSQPLHEGEPSTQTNELPADLPALDAWLCDRHPGLWHQIRTVDETLSRTALTTADYQQQLAILLQLYQQARDLKAGRWGALLIRSDVLGGEEVWVVHDEAQAQALQTDGKAVYFVEEFALLKTKTPAEIRDIHHAKLAFPGCRVVQ